MIEVTQAIRTARKYLVELYKSTDFQLDGLLLEGVERSEDDKYWLITFGFDVEKPIVLNLLKAAGEISPTLPLMERVRSYHTIWVDMENGIPEKMIPG